MSIADGELTSIALCWRIERTDGAGIALTSHDRALFRDGIMYEPTPGMMPASVTKSVGLDPDTGEVAGALCSESLDEQDLTLGRWDGAEIRLSAVDWKASSESSIRLLAGELGDVAIDGEGFSADLRGAAARLDGAVCPATSAECRANFGDGKCRVDLAGRSIRARVIEANGSELVLDRAMDDRFVLGRLRYLSGENCGLTTIVLGVAGSTVQVRDLPRGAVEAGCRVDLREGCDKRFDTCVNRFGNAANFRGEPHLPGIDLLTRYPGA